MVTEVLFEYRRGGCDCRAPGNSLSLSVKFDDFFFTSTWLLITGFFLLWNIISGLQYVGINTLLNVAKCQQHKYHMRENFHWIKVLPSPAMFVLEKKFTEKKFTNVVKVTTSSMQYLTQDKCDKFSPMRAGGEISKNFLLANIR